MKKIVYWALLASFPLAFVSCEDGEVDEDPYVEELFSEDLLVGGSWRWTETVWEDDIVDGFSYVEYAHDDLSFFFESDGHVSIRSNFESPFGRSDSDWIDGRWNFSNGELHIDTYSGSWKYEIRKLDESSMVLVYYDEYNDDWGNVIPRRVEEHYSR